MDPILRKLHHVHEEVRHVAYRTAPCLVEHRAEEESRLAEDERYQQAHVLLHLVPVHRGRDNGPQETSDIRRAEETRPEQGASLHPTRRLLLRDRLRRAQRLPVEKAHAVRLRQKRPPHL